MRPYSIAHSRAYTVARCTQPSLNRMEHTTELALHTTEPACFVNKRCLLIAYIANSYICERCKYSPHTHSLCSKQYASLTQLVISWYWTVTLICCLLFSLQKQHTTGPRCSVVCVYAAGLCASWLGCVEGHPWYRALYVSSNIHNGDKMK